MPVYRDVTRILVAAGVVASLLAGCAGKSVRKGVDDLTITARVKTALLNAPPEEIRAPRIDVQTVNGIVTLTGRVSSKEEEQKAIEIARSVGGVVEVKSALQVGG
jgi:hyperosmotically inducible periplasmic protein